LRCRCDAAVLQLLPECVQPLNVRGRRLQFIGEYVRVDEAEPALVAGLTNYLERIAVLV
jgi:hypothetical protein